jgi:hypothetical protein
MSNNFEKRLEKLEAEIKQSADIPVWIDGSNATIRVDVNHRRGQPVTFPSVYEARVWIEKQINSHAGGRISYTVDSIADLHENAEGLRQVLKAILPGQIVVEQKTRSSGGVFEPDVYSVDDLDATLALVGVSAGAPADIRLWCLASLMRRYFWNKETRERWNSDKLTQDDERMFFALLAVFSWKRPGSEEEIKADFARLFVQVTELTVSEAA